MAWSLIDIACNTMKPKTRRMVVGLGNPGRKYRNTRHNLGFMVVDALAHKWTILIDRRKKDIQYGYRIWDDMRVCLAKPTAYMNNSGPPTRRLADRLGFSGEDLIIVHDDIDLAFGRLKIKEKGGSGGHKGIKSMIEAFGGGAFTRLRVGIGRSEHGSEVIDHVLRTFNPSEKKALPMIIDETVAAVDTVLHQGTLEGMNRFNRKTGILTETKTN